MIKDVHAKIIIIILMIIFIIPCCTIIIALKLTDSLSNTFFNFLLFKFNSLKYKLFKYLICTRNRTNPWIWQNISLTFYNN